MTLMFKAQNLNNSDQDHYQIGNEYLLDNDDRAGTMTKKISEIANSGKYVFKSPIGMDLIVLGDWFLISTIPEERDIERRISPIICVGRFSDMDLQTLISGINQFANKIGRTVDRDVNSPVYIVFEDLTKKIQKGKKSFKKILVLTGIVGIVGATGLMMIKK